MKKLIVILAFGVASLSASAESWFNASLTPDIAVESRDTQINGLTLSIYGENPQTSFALGFVNGSTGDSAGVQFGLFNWGKGNFTGWQSAWVNFCDGKLVGAQTGLFNKCGTATGAQLGFVNWAESGEGLVQIGFANIIEDNGWFENLPEKFATGFVFVNWGF